MKLQRNVLKFTHIMKNLPIGTLVICKGSPEWGAFKICEDYGLYYDIKSKTGGRVLSKDEAEQFWEVAQ